MVTCNCPTLTFPNGGEIINDRALNIIWYSPTPHHPDGLPTWYEIFFTDAYEDNKKIEWKQIASVPSNVSTFGWMIPGSIRSTDCRLAIRCRDASGDRSNLAITDDNFQIGIFSLSSPAVISPVSNSAHRLSVPIIFADEGIKGSPSQRAFYQAHYSSKELEIDWTPISESIPIESGTFTWDVRGMAPSNDYSVKFALVDEDNNSSPPVIIENVKISPLNAVWLDTVPPSGSVTVQNNEQFTSRRDIVVGLSAFDETTKVESVVIRQTNLNPDGTVQDGSETEQDEQVFSEMQTWRIAGEDGAKFLEAQYKDTAGNIIPVDAGKRFFRSLLSSGGSEVLAIAIDQDDIWSVFNDSPGSVYRNQELITTVSDVITDMVIFDGIPYMGARDSEDKGVLYKLQDGVATKVYEFTDLDSVVNTLAVFDDLYIGLRIGDLYKFDKSTVSLVTTFTSQVVDMFSDDALLYVALENTDEIKIFDGSSFLTASLIDGGI